MDKNVFWVRIWSLLFAIIAAIAVSGFAYSAYATRLFVTNNYCEVTLQGSHNTAWQKCVGAK